MQVTVAVVGGWVGGDDLMVGEGGRQEQSPSLALQ